MPRGMDSPGNRGAPNAIQQITYFVGYDARSHIQALGTLAELLCDPGALMVAENIVRFQRPQAGAYRTAILRSLMDRPRRANW